MKPHYRLVGCLAGCSYVFLILVKEACWNLDQTMAEVQIC